MRLLTWIRIYFFGGATNCTEVRQEGARATAAAFDRTTAARAPLLCMVGGVKDGPQVSFETGYTVLNMIYTEERTLVLLAYQYSVQLASSLHSL